MGENFVPPWVSLLIPLGSFTASFPSILMAIVLGLCILLFKIIRIISVFEEWPRLMYVFLMWVCMERVIIAAIPDFSIVIWIMRQCVM